MPRQDTKKSIFEAGVTVFAKYGYKGALMDTIAEEAGVAKGTLYYHFKSKEEIFVFTMEEGIREIVDGVRSEAEGMDNIIAKLTTICRVQLEMMKSKADFFRVLFSQLMGLEDRQSSLRLRLRDYILYLQGIIGGHPPGGAARPQRRPDGVQLLRHHPLFRRVRSAARR